MPVTERAVTATGQRLPERWFHGDSRPRSGAVRMICFPHAGGTPSVYHDWAARLGERVQVVAVLLPGRGLRMSEEPYRVMASLAQDAAEALLGCGLADNYVLFGHSMGALLAYETACRLRVLGAREPKHLFVSGSRAPHHYGVPMRRSLDDDGLRRLVAELGGLGADEAMGRAYLERRLPVLRADLAACENYRWEPRAPLNCPMTAFSAAGDPIATTEQMDAWREYTDGSLLRRHLPGGHFYLTGPSRLRLLRELRAELDRVAPLRAPEALTTTRT
ncbi:thioesterase II family protein [Streptomyces sp. CG1]|uniref:thioesterase II family protein n=1 Tax=Streptomyces sp. CG1 TaxID=1287523 RepID=UPI0034E2FB8B